MKIHIVRHVSVLPVSTVITITCCFPETFFVAWRRFSLPGWYCLHVTASQREQRKMLLTMGIVQHVPLNVVKPDKNGSSARDTSSSTLNAQLCEFYVQLTHSVNKISSTL